MPYYLLNINKIKKSLTAENIVKELFKVEQFKLLILNLNRGQLYFKGIDAIGVSLGEYASSTINFSLDAGDPFDGKKAKNQPFDRITLKDTGAFYKSFVLELQKNADLLINANTIKDNIDLRIRYGEDILGLTEQSLERVVADAKNIIIPLIKNLILQK